MMFMGKSATVRAVPSLHEMRLGLRAVRREFEFSLDALSEQSGIDRAAIHKIENIEKYPDYEPGVDTFRRLVEGLGLTLQRFFARFPDRPQADSGTIRPIVEDRGGADHAHDRALKLLEMMSGDGHAAAAGLLAELAKAFPPVQPQRSPARTVHRRAATKKITRG